MRVIFILFFIAFLSFGQSIVSEYAENTNFPIQDRLTTERILVMASTRRTFILSHKNKGFFNGDYVTLIYKNEHVARAVTAKITEDERAGLKTIKVYNEVLWERLKTGMDVQVLRGDDSYFVNRVKEVSTNNEKTEEDIARINGEDDLYNDTTFLEEDLDNDERKKRKIKTDNIFSGNFSFIDTVDLTGEATTDANLGFSYAYQVANNIWGEFTYGYSSLSGFPAAELTSELVTVIVRGKYTFSGPFYSFFMPYIGYQVSVLDAPEYQPGDFPDENTRAALIDEVEDNKPVFGITILKRMVPGWFARADIGNDIVNIGAALEF